MYVFVHRGTVHSSKEVLLFILTLTNDEPKIYRGNFAQREECSGCPDEAFLISHFCNFGI